MNHGERDVLTQAWCSRSALLIVDALSDGPRRFCELERACALNPSSLSKRLRELRALGIVDRSDEPVRAGYALSARGCRLLPVIDAMRDYERTWLTVN